MEITLCFLFEGSRIPRATLAEPEEDFPYEVSLGGGDVSFHWKFALGVK